MKLVSDLKETKEKKVMTFNVLRFDGSYSSYFSTYLYTHTYILNKYSALNCIYILLYAWWVKWTK